MRVGQAALSTVWVECMYENGGWSRPRCRCRIVEQFTVEGDRG